MTNRIMELADQMRQASVTNFQTSDEWRDVLATEVQAQQDYTRAVIAERDALKAELKKEEDAHDADVNDLGYHLRNSITSHKQAEDQLEALRKAAQMALEKLDAGYAVVTASAIHKALRRELEQ